MMEEIIVTSCCGEKNIVRKETVDTVGLDEYFKDVEDGEEIKSHVRKRYARVVTHNSGCGCSPNNVNNEFTFVDEDYGQQEGYFEDADLGLGCGVPTELAGIQQGDTVLDLGSGAGIDAFIARREVGNGGEVLGVDFTPEMVEKAKENAEKLGYDNVRFIHGDIEDLPLDSDSVDVVISNCVLNLVPHKYNAFAEMHRVLKTDGHFTVSDIVIQGDIPDRLRESAELYAGCVSGAIERTDYLKLLGEVGFEDVEVVKEHAITIADDILLQVASQEEVTAFNETGGISSITVRGYKRD